MNCPFLMSDGRHFTEYRGSKYVNNEIYLKNKVGQNSFNNFLQNYGLTYLNDQKEKNKYTCQNNNFGNCYTNVRKQRCEFDICNTMLELKK